MQQKQDATVSRRHFIRLGAAGAAAAVAGCAGRTDIMMPEGQTVETPVVEGPPRLKTALGIQSYSFRNFKFEEAIARCAKLGLEEIEPFPGHFPAASKPEDIARIQALLEASSVRMNSYGVCGMDKNEAQARPIFAFCKRVDIPAISISPAPDAFDLLDKLCAEYDIKVGIHNHGPGDKRWGKTEQMVQGIANHHPNVGVWLDTGHLERSGCDPVEAIRAIGPRLHGLHLKDTADGHDKVLGTGKTDLLACIQALREVRFKGAFNFEYEMDADNPDPGIAKSIVCVRALIAKVNQA